MVDINFLKNDEVKNVLSWMAKQSVIVLDASFQCESRDIFQAKLDTFFSEIKNSLLTAVVGEIGNNSFDHNLGSWVDVVGVYFKVLPHQKLIILADRGQGVKATLSRIIPNIVDDKKALEIAFTEIISGRSPEHRGNGLKFVLKALKSNGFELYFQSGKGIAHISKDKIDFLDSDLIAKGCIAIIKY